MTTEEREKIYAEKTKEYFGDIGFCVPIAGFADELFDMIDERDKWIAAIYPLLRYAEKYPTDSGRSEFSNEDEFAFQSLLSIAKAEQ